MRYECGKYAEFVPFCRKKLQRLIVPYIFVSAFWVVPFSVYFFDLSMKDVFIMGTITVRSKTRNAGSLAIRNEELGME